MDVVGSIQKGAVATDGDDQIDVADDVRKVDPGDRLELDLTPGQRLAQVFQGIVVLGVGDLDPRDRMVTLLDQLEESRLPML